MRWLVVGFNGSQVLDAVWSGNARLTPPSVCDLHGWDRLSMRTGRLAFMSLLNWDPLPVQLCASFVPNGHASKNAAAEGSKAKQAEAGHV